ncbi:MAG: hypothetical protein KDC31_07060 [Saprospiraceae bacterium]|jgi:hypothetical protein|nr:hypothetical protein [Candidatus Parvibacillus calidus]MBX2938002.1 hypothetical protein [Saprospiraceae bacterium]MBX7179405.1 hypothetical protein [Saprospiraceae bacterium]MCB0591033.1 hypothetical protein [Saprospiraceae bacterium]MCC7148779.1 hypothetical protein [Saprospiraceae bacterium]
MKNQDMMIVYPDYEEPINVLKVFFNAQKIKFEPSNESHTPLSLAKKLKRHDKTIKKEETRFILPSNSIQYGSNLSA